MSDPIEICVGCGAGVDEGDTYCVRCLTRIGERDAPPGGTATPDDVALPANLTPELCEATEVFYRYVRLRAALRVEPPPKCEHDWYRPMQPAATDVKVCRKCGRELVASPVPDQGTFPSADPPEDAQDAESASTQSREHPADWRDTESPGSKKEAL